MNGKTHSRDEDRKDPAHLGGGEKEKGVLSIAPVERKREWEGDEERDGVREEGYILGQVP